MTESVVFLDGEAIRASIEDVMDSSSPSLDIAVAYWSGRGLPKLASGHWDKKTRIICDLMSGFCEVAFIRQLRTNENVDVKMMRNLHAKVYLGTASAIIGSANASGAGLNATPQSRQEAAVLIREGAALDRAHDWFELMWKRATEVNEADLDRAAEIEQARRNVEGRLAGEQPTEAHRFWDILTTDAINAVMKFARNTPSAEQVKFGKLGSGEEPNFTLTFNDGSKRSFHFPNRNGDATEYQGDWRDENLTEPVNVIRWT